MLKSCITCGIEKENTLEFFHKTGRVKLSGKCKICKGLYYSERKEDILKKVKTYREENIDAILRYRMENKEKYKSYSKKYKERNKETVLEHKRKYREKNKESISLYAKGYRSENKDKGIVLTQKRRARKSNLLSTFTSIEWERVVETFDRSCAYCGEEKDLEQEHFVPLSKGGEYAYCNIIPACKTCNCSKHDKDFCDWYPNYKHYDKQRENKILKHLALL